MMQESKTKGTDRRSFLKGAAFLGAGAAATGLVAACTPSSSGDGGQTSGAPTGGAADADKLTAASLDQEWSFMTPPDPVPDSDIAETVTADIVIIGTGMSGLCTAVKAQEDGADVRVFSAGTMPISRGGSNHGVGSKYQREMGVDYTPEIAMRVMKAWQGTAQMFVDTKKWGKWLANSAESMDWMIDIMAEAGLKVSLELPSIDPDDLYSVPAGAHNFYNEENPMGAATGAPLQAQAYADRFTSKGGQIDYQTEAIYLVREDDNKGRVSGVVAKRGDGTYVKYTANKAIVMATGDFSRDRDLMARYCPLAYQLFRDVLAFDEPVNWDAGLEFSGLFPGSGQKMGLWVGAAWQTVDPCAPMIIGGSSGPAFIFGNAFTGIAMLSDGKRFQNEIMPMTWGALRLLRVPGGRIYSVWDSDYAYATDKWGGFGVAVNEANGIPSGTPETQLAAWDEGVANRAYFKADTLEELLDQMEGIDKAAALESIAQWNGYCEAGVDEEFNVNPVILRPIAKGPFYGGVASRETMQFLTVCGGLRTNADMQVCDADDQPVEGLYNTGIMTGDLYAGCYNFILPGQNLGGVCCTMSYLLGRDLAKL